MESNIVNKEVAKLAYEIAGYVHKPVEQVVMQAIRELAAKILPQAAKKSYESGLDLMSPVYDWRDGDDILYDEDGLPKTDKPMYERIMDIRKRCAELPILDSRSAEEIIGYDENGLLPE